MNKDDILAQKAIKYIKANKKKILGKFADPSVFLPEKNPISVFMAGSPGAGKTEFSKKLIIRIPGRKSSENVVRIDTDEIRDMLPDYNGKNSYIFQGAVSVGVDKIHDSVLSRGQSFILDGTFTNYDKSYQNIERSLKKKRPVFIMYLYQDPLIAWHFTKKREKVEGRCISKEVFIKELFSAKENVNRIKETFGEKVNITLVENDFTHGLVKNKLNIKTIDSYLSIKYTEGELEKELL